MGKLIVAVGLPELEKRLGQVTASRKVGDTRCHTHVVKW